VMIDATGHIKLTDFGLSEVGLERLRMNASTLRSFLTRENSMIDNSPPMNRDEAWNKIERADSLYFQRSDSISPEQLNYPLVAGDDSNGTLNSLQRLDSQTYERDLMGLSSMQIAPSRGDFGFRRNKLDEATVFPFLATPEERANWKKGDNKLGVSQKMTQSLRRKEKRRIVGTPDYIAPEIIRGEDCNDKAIDLWSLGVILYEFIVGIPPFNDETIDKIFGNILQLQMEWPDIGYEEDCMTPEAADLIKKLINPNPKERIKIRDIKKHPFFKGFDWQNTKQMTPPLVPKKKEIDPDVALLDIGTIFKTNNYKLMKRNSIIQEIPTFNTKRYDLLHQLNENLYKNHLKDNPEDLEGFDENPGLLKSSVSTLYP